MEFYFPKMCYFWPSAGRLHGRPRQRSVDRAVDRRAQNVRGLFGWRASWPIQSTAREFCSLEMAPVDRAVDRQRVSALCIRLRSTDRSTGGSTVGNPTIGGRPAGRLTAVWTAELASNGQILDAYKSGFLWTVFYKILENFQASFSHLFQRFSPLVLELILPFKRRVYQEFFKRRFLEFLTTNSILVFSHTLKLSIAISIL